VISGAYWIVCLAVFAYFAVWSLRRTNREERRLRQARLRLDIAVLDQALGIDPDAWMRCPEAPQLAQIVTVQFWASPR